MKQAIKTKIIALITFVIELFLKLHYIFFELVINFEYSHDKMYNKAIYIIPTFRFEIYRTYPYKNYTIKYYFLNHFSMLKIYYFTE